MEKKFNRAVQNKSQMYTEWKYQREFGKLYFSEFYWGDEDS